MRILGDIYVAFTCKPIANQIGEHSRRALSAGKGSIVPSKQVLVVVHMFVSLGSNELARILTGHQVIHLHCILPAYHQVEHCTVKADGHQ